MVKHNKQYYDDVYHLLKKQDNANSHTGYCAKYNLSRDFIMHNDADSCKARVLLPIDYSKL